MKTPTILEGIDLSDLLGDDVEWVSDVKGFLPCPGRHLHTHHTGKKDTAIYLEGAPTIFCFHEKCRDVVKEANDNLRGALRAAGFAPPPMTQDRRDYIVLAEHRQKVYDRLLANREFIFEEYKWDVKDITESGFGYRVGYRVGSRTFIERMFHPTDIIWLGDPHNTGPWYENHFQTRNAFLGQTRNAFLGGARALSAYGNFICPNPIKPKANSRSVENLAMRRYFVIECDKAHPNPDINRDRCGAVFKYLSVVQPELHLRAIVDSGNKSLHGWYEYDEPLYNWCRIVLPALGADPATMRLSQPVRMPGADRPDTGRTQWCIWMDTRFTPKPVEVA